MSKKVHFISLGCPKNLVDTEIMLGHLKNADYEVTAEVSQADTVVVNTCGFVEDSKRESISTILDMAELKKSGSLRRLVVAGCLTQRYKDQLVDELPEADIFVGSGEFQKIAKILSDADAGVKEKKYFSLPTYLQEENSPRVISGPQYHAFLKISEGCMKRCSFCAIPRIRGNLQSRTVASIVKEAKDLVAQGVKEISIVSHDFTDYGWDLRKQGDTTATSVNLLRALSDVEGLEWIRVMYLYPDGVTPELVQLIRERANLVKYFDIPLQHINNEMLRLMNRKTSREQIEGVLELIRREIPDAVIRTQFIVGFPGETEEAFRELMDFIVTHRFDRVGCFRYSPEEGTVGFRMKQTVDEKTKKRRHDTLMGTQKEISRQVHERYLGRTLQVLVEGVSSETELLLQGRMSQQAPEIDGVVLINSGEAQPGDMVQVLVTETLDYDLVGEIVEKQMVDVERHNSVRFGQLSENTQL